MLRHSGTATLETARLILRRFQPDDAQDMFDNWAGDPMVTRFLTWPAHKDVSVTQRVIQQWLQDYQNPETYQWAIVPKQTGRPAGSISLGLINNARMCAEAGYCLGRAFWGNGLMTEALREVLVYGFETVGFYRIQARHHVENPASGRVMQKAGMTYEGRLRGYDKTGTGQFADCELYAILRTDPVALG